MDERERDASGSRGEKPIWYRKGAHSQAANNKSRYQMSVQKCAIRFNKFR